MVDVIVKTRDEVVANYKRSYKLRLPDADTRDGMQPDINARCCADMVMPCYANAKALGRGLLLSGRAGSELDEAGELEGVPRLEAKGASGFVEFRAGSSGARAFDGDELTDQESQLVYRCTKTLKYFDGDSVPVEAKDTGPTTNIDADTVLQWSQPRPGMYPTCTVVEQTDGSGLTGGRDEENDDDYVARIIEARRKRSNAGNDAEYQRVARETPGVGVEQPFTYPSILGPGTTGLAFTIKPATTGASRAPNAAQIAEVEEYLRGLFPADDGLIMCLLVDEDLTIQARVKWDTNVEPWIDTVPWPPYYEVAGTPGAVEVSAAADFEHITLICNGSVYTNVTQPTVGANFAVYDAGHARFSRKKILSVAGAGPWTIVCDTSESSTDSYVPAVGQLAMPWSESLQLLVKPCVAYVNRMGPGEQVAIDPGDGQRQMRSPRPKATLWPHEIGNRLETELQVDGVADLRVENVDPSSTTVGTQGVLAYIMRLADFAIYRWS
jgi:uncharacterized phage protein gp47/JayE